MKTPDKVANYLRVHAVSSEDVDPQSETIEVEYQVREKADAVGLEGDPEIIPDEAAKWLAEQRERIAERGGTLLVHRVIPCDYRVEDPPMMDFRDVDFVVANFPESA